MSVSIIAGLLIVWQVVAGFSRGAVRAVANLVGLVAAILLSPRAGELLDPLVFQYLTKNPVWERTLAVGIAGFLIWLITVIAGRLIHYGVLGPAEPFWSFGLNKKLGMFIGFVEGLVIAFVFLWIIYFLGTVAWLFQPMATGQGRSAPPEGSLPAFLINSKADLRASPLGPLISELDPMPHKVYDAVALIGVLADQPKKRGRLEEYSPFQRLQRMKTIDEALNDCDLSRMVAEQRPLTYFVWHPKIIALFQDRESREALEKFDWAAALKFINTRETHGR